LPCRQAILDDRRQDHREAVSLIRPDSCIPSPVNGYSEVSVTASIGTAMYPFDADAATELLSVADRRMYEFKRQGKASAGIPTSSIIGDANSAFAAANSTLGRSR
jgi:GGDEF domain-containing protein